jgi:hypothetical protein
MKKILLDPENGLVVTETKNKIKTRKKMMSRKKRSAVSAEAAPLTEEATPSTTSTTPPPSTTAEAIKDDSDPNGHSHGKKNNFKMEAAMMMKPFMYPFGGGGRMFEAAEAAAVEAGGKTSRRVKIDFVQNGEDLPEGTIETISAGGGKAPGHHEGGGLTVKVKEAGEAVEAVATGGVEAKREMASRKKQEARKTLNFFFTW